MLHPSSITLVVVLSLIAAPLWAGEAEPPEGPRLRLTAERWTAQVGERVELYLLLDLPGAEVMLDGHEELTPGERWYSGTDAIGAHTMQIRSSFRPEEAGFIQIGPFELDLGGEILTSNALDFHVFPAWQRGEEGFRWQLSQEVVRVGQPFDLTVRHREIGEDADAQYVKIATPTSQGSRPGVRYREASTDTGATATSAMRKAMPRPLVSTSPRCGRANYGSPVTCSRTCLPRS